MCLFTINVIKNRIDENHEFMKNMRPSLGQATLCFLMEQNGAEIAGDSKKMGERNRSQNSREEKKGKTLGERRV